MKTFKTALIAIGKNTARQFHLAANCDEEKTHIDAFNCDNEFVIAIEKNDREKSRRFETFAEFAQFIGQENLMKKRCFLRFF